MKRDLSHSDFAGLELQAIRCHHVSRYEQEDYLPEMSEGAGFLLTAGTFLLGISPVLIVLYFAVNK